MSFIGRLFGRKRKIDSFIEEKEGRKGFSAAFRQERVDINDRRERESYVKGCIGQIADAERGIHQLEYEYSMVTSRLTDMEEFERLPKKQKLEIQDVAQKLYNLENRQSVYREKQNRMSEEEFSKMEGFKGEAEEGIQKIRETEEYLRLVKSDLRKLNGERHSYEYRRDELEVFLKNYTGIAIICFAAMGVCFLVLLILQLAFQFDTKLGYVLVVCAIALIMIRLFMKHSEGQKELAQIEKDINRLILLQNTVKIRYVNYKNLLDYLCLKFRVQSSGELEALWEKYQEEKEEREEMEQASKDFVYYQKELLRLLRQSEIKDTSIWLHQTAALLEKEEWEVLRLNLTGRRKALREQMDYNRELAGEAQTEIKAICAEYPRYREEIMGWITEAENNMKK